MNNPFARDNEVDQPGIIGARWWNSAVQESTGATGRRTALGCLTASVIGVAALITIPIIAVAADGCGGDDDEKEEARPSLKLQEDFGWNFDVPTETVTFSPTETKQYVRAALATLVEDLTPKRTDLAPYAVHTLFQSPEALPKIKLADGSNANIKPIAEALRPISTVAMARTLGQGKALAAELSASNQKVAVIVDCDGPSAVSLAAGLADTHDPVFLFDNWPHPHGVVSSHLTLAAAVFHQADFASTKKSRLVDAPPVLVLDRTRLSPYTDSASAFDNRYVARLPSADQLVKKLGYRRVLYVTDTVVGPMTRSDVGNTLSNYATEGADVRALLIDAFTSTTGGKYDYAEKGGTGALAQQYGWAADTGQASSVPAKNASAHAWRPAWSTPDTSLTTLGVTTVAVAVATGYVLRRSGTWNRAPSGSWGGG